MARTAAAGSGPSSHARIAATPQAPAASSSGTRSGRNPVFWIRAGPGTTTLRFFAVDDAGNRGPTASATYVVTPP